MSDETEQAPKQAKPIEQCVTHHQDEPQLPEGDEPTNPPMAPEDAPAIQAATSHEVPHRDRVGELEARLDAIEARMVAGLNALEAQVARLTNDANFRDRNIAAQTTGLSHAIPHSGTDYWNR